MKDKIERILEEYKIEGAKKALITEELCVLFNVIDSNSFDIHNCINDVCDAVEAKIAYISPMKPKGNGSFRWRVKQAIDKMLYSR